MVVSNIKGGLGNQLFQWACNRNLSIKYNIDTYIDNSSYLNQIGVTERTFSLDKFPLINYNISNTKPTNKINDDFHYREIKLDNDTDYYLDGYWQSEKYFIENERIIREELKPTEYIELKLKGILPKGYNISLHIRRTDYVKLSDYHPVQPLEYYERSLDIIGEYDNLIIFSDDIEWCKSNLKFNNMIFIEGMDDVEDLWLMSMCKDNIIANSSFSWWGAWLNDNPKKKVISPIKWFGDKVNLNTSDLIPNKWVRI